MMAALVWVLTVFVGCAGGGGSTVVRAPRFELSGTVRGSEGEPLSHASIVLVGSPRGSLTDATGGFGIGDLRPGDYQLTVVYLGYRSVPAFLRVREPVQTTVTLAMVRDPRLGPARVESIPPVTVSYELTRLP
jgi:hypothetical protein